VPWTVSRFIGHRPLWLSAAYPWASRERAAEFIAPGTDVEETLRGGLAEVWRAEPAGTERTVTDTKDESRPLSFERDIKPLFRDKDRSSMLKAFDLWSFTDVAAHQDAILEQLRSGHMPCDGAWPAEKVSTFADWISEGSQP
jgi:hypothetical protein